MPNNLDQIVDCLHQLVQIPVRQRAAAFSDRDSQPGYLYLNGIHQRDLYAEALEKLPETDDPPQPMAQVSRLVDLGWNLPLPGDMHCYRVWHVESETERLTVARQIQQTLEVAYGIDAQQPLNIEFAAS